MTSEDSAAALVCAFEFGLDTGIAYVVVHGVEDETDSAVEEAGNFSEHALV